MSAPALSLAGLAEHEEEIKKSRFIARAQAVSSAEAALAFLARVRDPAATHNCWAYRIGERYRFSDDGEPGGTAGKPILGAIDRQGVDRVVVVVTRFFGGVKLGAGGLARAYGNTAASCLRLADKVEIRQRLSAIIRAGFDAVGALHLLLEQERVEKLSETYTGAGVELRVAFDARDREVLAAMLRDRSRGALSLAEIQPLD